ncbi:CLUMA_CG017548, isoform A, partial [Clunio marinus]
IIEEFFWLRFLEVEVNETKNFQGSKSFKKLCKMEKMGQSIFTVTKRLRKEDENLDFGFESGIVWTKPCFINTIEKNSPADQSHLEVGDFIIFIDKMNIVDMKISDIMSLINKSDVLTIEVFRRSKAKTSVIPMSIIQKATSKNQNEETILENKTIDEFKRNRLESKSSTDSKKKHLTFSKDESSASESIDSQKNYKILNNFLQCERQFVNSLIFGANRYISPLTFRKDLISTKEHELVFKNIEYIKNLMEMISNRKDRNSIEDVIQSYVKHSDELIQAYESYFTTVKSADCIIVDKTHQSEFIKFIVNPSIPSNQPVFHSFIHLPAEYYNDLQKNFQLILSQLGMDGKEYHELNLFINNLKKVYSEAMHIVSETKTGVKPILRNLESRLVFTAKCKPFKLDISGRHWIFGGDLIRIEGNSLEKPVYTLLFSDILVFSTINRDRVLFISEEPISLKSIVESFFNIRKKEKDFRLTIDTNPNYNDHSPTTHCTPDLIRRSPLRQFKRRNIHLRAHSEEVKKVWQNLITQQIFNVNSVSHSNSSNHIESLKTILLRKPSNQTDNFTDTSTNKSETEDINGSRSSNQLNLKSQNAFDLDDPLDQFLNDGSSHLETPETPSCANVSSLCDNMQKSISITTFSSNRNTASDCCDSEYGDIFNGFDSRDISFSNDVKECMFMQNDPFFADES